MTRGCPVASFSAGPDPTVPGGPSWAEGVPGRGERETRASAASEGSADLGVYIEPIYRFVYARIGIREDAEDVTSQVFVKAVRWADTARGELSLRSWLYQVARTSIADYWRERYRRDAQVVPLEPARAASVDDDLDDEASEAPWLAAEPAEAEPGHEAALVVREILDQLPENYRRVLTLRFLEALPIKAVAAIMQISEGNVKVLQYRALQKAAQIGSARR